MSQESQEPSCRAPACAPAARGSGTGVQAVLISPYELGRQPFSLAQAAAWFKRAGLDVACLDLSLQRLAPEVLAGVPAVIIHLPMHTATRIAVEALPRIRSLAPTAAIAAYGLYAPVNEAWLRGLGVDAVFGGESEPDLVAWVQSVLAGGGRGAPLRLHTSRMAFLVPDRSGLPSLSRYAHLVLPDGSRRTAGFVETTRGCKHLCRHCPVVPVYRGQFRAVPLPVVMADIEQQVAMGAQHVSFTDHDFLNGPGHALKVIRAMHERFPGLTFDATIKIEHLVRHGDLLPELKARGCLFVISAVESVDDAVLQALAKGHTRADFHEAVARLRAIGLPLAPTWVAFHPWTTLEGYLELLQTLVDLRLVEAVPPVQLSIRLLVPAGSELFALPGFDRLVEPFDGTMLGHPWRHRDARVDALQREVQALVAQGEQAGESRRAIFTAVWEAAHRALGRRPAALDGLDLGEPVPHLSEPWYCCAEPTAQQLQSF